VDAQKEHWEDAFANKPDMFGAASDPAQYAAGIFKKENSKKILELGAGQGRDTLFFAQNGFEIYALDYSRSGLKEIMRKTQALGLSESLRVISHDVRNPSSFYR
jgi:cyclopropane fatty-acyl-phospholipid synthase-like methyltransferase